MSYATRHIADILRNARKAQGLSQRELGAKAGIGQGHISKIENGSVDLRVSSLVELARMLDMDLVLVPRKVVPAVRAIAGRSDGRTSSSIRTWRRILNEYRRLQDTISLAVRSHPTLIELTRIQQIVRELQHFPLPANRLEEIRSAATAVKAFQDKTAGPEELRNALARLHVLRNELAHASIADNDAGPVLPAYSLDDRDHG